MKQDFNEILDILGDNKVNDNNVKKIIFVTGKHFYALDQKRKELGLEDAAIIRVESLCPFPVSELYENITKFKYAKSMMNKKKSFFLFRNSFVQNVI